MNRFNNYSHAHHHFTTPKSPKSNGTVETVCKEVIRACRTLMSEFRLKPSEWTLVIRIVQSILNHSFGPISTTSLLLNCLQDFRQTILRGHFYRWKNLKQVQWSTSNHRNTSTPSVSWSTWIKYILISRKRELVGVKKRSVRTTPRPMLMLHSLMSGILYGLLKSTQLVENPHLKWIGPRRVTRALSEHTYEVQDNLTKSLSLIHSNRLKFCADSKLNVIGELRDNMDHISPTLNTLCKLLDLWHNFASDQWEVKTKWMGLFLRRTYLGTPPEPAWIHPRNSREVPWDLSRSCLSGRSHCDLAVACL